MSWIGIDLDGTLAEHYWPDQGPYSHTRIGEPISAMVARIKVWRARGYEMRIFTARVGPQKDGDVVEEARHAIETWCKEHLGFTPQVTATKDYAMYQLWDDRCVRVIQNTGMPCCEREIL
jgi:hypothetical protein